MKNFSTNNGMTLALCCFGLSQIPNLTYCQVQQDQELGMRRGGIQEENIRQTEFHRLLDIPLKQARNLIEEGKNIEAEQMSRKALALDNSCAYGWLYLAKSLENQGKNELSLAAYKDLMSRAWASSIATDPVTKMRFALALNRTKHWSDSVEVFNDAIVEGTICGGKVNQTPFNPNFPDYFRMQGLIHLVIGARIPTYGELSDKERESHLKAAIRLLPTNALAYFSLGNLFKLRDNPQESYYAYKKAAQFGEGELGKRASEIVQLHDYYNAQQLRKVKKVLTPQNQADAPR